MTRDTSGRADRVCAIEKGEAPVTDDVMARVVEVVGDPFYHDDTFVLFNTDCVAGMSRLAPMVDLTVTSPPYNIGKAYEGTRTLDEYLEWSREWIKAVHRVTKPSGSFWLNLGYTPLHDGAKALPLAYLLWDASAFYLIQEVVWNYGAGVAGKKFYSPRNEKFLWYVRDAGNYVFNLDDVRDPDVKYPRQFKNGKLKVNPNGKNPTDVWQFPKVTSGRDRSSAERTPHPAQFPEAVIDRIVKASSNAGDLVLDPFMGSGTTAVVAARLGRRTIGFEIDAAYCELAVNRYKQDRAAREAALNSLF